MLRVSQAKGWRYKGMLEQIDQIIKVIDEAVWGLPLIILILFTGFLLTTRLGLLNKTSRESTKIYVSK